MRAVIALCLVALVGAQVASAAYIYQQTYTADFVNHPENFFCNGTANPVSSFANFTAGECQNTANNASSSQYFCDTDAVIVIQYSYGGCGVANATSMGRIPTTCGAGSTSSKWVCSGKDTLPTGLAWPPTGQWSQSSTQYNNTYDGTASSPSAGACGTLPASARAVTTQGAAYVGCKNTQSTAYTQASSVQYFTGGWAGSYTGLDCKNLVSLTQPFGTATCTNGVTGTGIPDGNPAPSTPTNTNSVTASATKFTKKDTNYCDTKVSTTYYTNTCLNGYKVDCVNGTIFTESKYTLTDGGNGACSGTYSANYPVVRNTSSAACTNDVTTGDNGFQYSCSGSSPDGPNSASTASFSVVALVIAAIVALLSQ